MGLKHIWLNFSLLLFSACVLTELHNWLILVRAINQDGDEREAGMSGGSVVE